MPLYVLWTTFQENNPSRRHVQFSGLSLTHSETSNILRLVTSCLLENDKHWVNVGWTYLALGRHCASVWFTRILFAESFLLLLYQANCRIFSVLIDKIQTGLHETWSLFENDRHWSDTLSSYLTPVVNRSRFGQGWMFPYNKTPTLSTTMGQRQTLLSMKHHIENWHNCSH